MKEFMIVLIFYRVKNTPLKPNNKKKKVIHSCDVFTFACNLDSWLHIISFITNNPEFRPSTRERVNKYSIENQYCNCARSEVANYERSFISKIDVAVDENGF